MPLSCEALKNFLEKNKPFEQYNDVQKDLYYSMCLECHMHRERHVTSKQIHRIHYTVYRTAIELHCICHVKCIIQLCSSM